ncbi:MAG: hypothetical protein AAF700_01595 [Pseudomonadota bacterium]
MDAFSISFKARLDHIMYLSDDDTTQWHTPETSSHITPYSVSVGDIVEERIDVIIGRDGAEISCAKVLFCKGLYEGPLIMKSEFVLVGPDQSSTVFDLARGVIYEDWRSDLGDLTSMNAETIPILRSFSHWTLFEYKVVLDQRSFSSVAAQVPLPGSQALILLALAALGSLRTLRGNRL